MHLFRPLVASTLVLGIGIAIVAGCVGEDPAPSSPEADGGTQPPTSSNDGSTTTPSSDGGTSGCEATLPADRACYTGPDGTRGKGRCKDGVLTCTSTGGTVCVGEVQPATTDPCNEIDDDCNGIVDDGVDKTKPENCGKCNNQCQPTETCQNGTCTKTPESCTNHVDDNGDGKVDCADPDCDGKVCGSGCVCANSKSIETTCNDGVDNDADGFRDCVDPDCLGKTCGAGKTCKADAGCN